MPGEHGTSCGCISSVEDLGAEDLLKFIDVDHVIGYNESTPSSTKNVFRPYEDRLDDSLYVETDIGDPELLIKIPFGGPCKISSMHVIGGDNGTSPSQVKIFANGNIDFSNVNELKPIQVIDLHEDFHGAVEYPLRVTHLKNITSLYLFFPSSFKGLQTRIHYIRLRGVGSRIEKRTVNAVYEIRNVKSDFSVKDHLVGSLGPGF